MLTGPQSRDSSRRIYSCIKSRNIGVAPSQRCDGIDLVALARVVSVGDGVGEDSVLQQCLHVPFGCALSLPCPEDPTSSLLVGVELSFNELADVVSVGAVESAD